MRADLQAAFRLLTCLPVTVHRNPRFEEQEASLAEKKRRNALSKANGDWSNNSVRVRIGDKIYSSILEAAQKERMSYGGIQNWIQSGRAVRLDAPSPGTRRYKKVTIAQRLSLRRSIGSGKA